MIKPPIPKYAAVPGDGEEATFSGEGDTPDLAIANFFDGEFDNYCDCCCHVGESIRLTVWEISRPEDSDWPAEEVNSRWKWVLNGFVEERMISHTVYVS